MNTIWEEIKDKGMVNRVFRNQSAHEIKKCYSGNHSDLLLRYELEDLHLLEQHNVPVPNVISNVITQGDSFLTLQDCHCTICIPNTNVRVPWKKLTLILESLHTIKEEKGRFGFHRPSFYGRTLYDNTWHTDWWEFFITTRWHVLIQKAEHAKWTELVSILCFLEQFLCKEIWCPPISSLLHGDIFANNVVCSCDKHQRLYLIDPVCFYGDPLMDFAKYHNKYESQPRTLLYKVYYAVDFDLHLHHRHLPSAERPEFQKTFVLGNVTTLFFLTP